MGKILCQHRQKNPASFLTYYLKRQLFPGEKTEATRERQYLSTADAQTDHSTEEKVKVDKESSEELINFKF